MDPTALQDALRLPILIALGAASAVVLAVAIRDAVVAWRRDDARWRAVLVVLVVVGLAARLFVAPPSPHDINWRAGEIYTPWQVTSWTYGMGMAAWGRLVLGALPFLPDDEIALFHVQAVVAAFTVVPLMGWARALGLGRVGAAIAGTWFALGHPLVRFGHTDVQAVPEMLATLVGLMAVARWARDGTRADAAVAGIALALASTFRPEGLVVLPVVGTLAWVAHRPAPDRRALWAVGAAAVLWVPHTAAMLTVAFGPSRMWQPSFLRNGAFDHGLAAQGWQHLIALDPAYVAPPLALAVVVGAAVPGHLRWTTRVALAGTAFVLSILVPNGTWTPAHGDQPNFARHQLRALPFAIVLGSHALATLVTRLPRAPGLVAAGLVGAATAWHLPDAARPLAYDTEYRWIRTVLPTLDEGCVITDSRPARDAGLAPPRYLPGHLHLRVDWVPPGDPRFDDAACRIWYRSASCHANDVAERNARARGEPASDALCAAFEATHDLTPIATGSVPARTYFQDTYDTDPVPIGFYRVSPSPGAATAPPGDHRDR